MDHFIYRNGVLHAEDVAITEIAASVGTPFYVYSQATLTRHFRVFDEALSKASVKAQVNSVVEHPKEGLKAHIITQESPENISKVLSPYTVGWELMK